MRFERKVYVVTGGAQGIGKAIVERLIEEGARVCILDREHADTAKEYGARALFARCDVSREPDVRRAVAAAKKWGGRLDGVVNNAGLADADVGPVERLALATWQRFLGVNLTGPFLVSKHAVPHLRKTRGAIVNIASTRAHQSEPDTLPYSASKGGVVALTHSLAISLGPEIRVNCISPGWIATDEFKPHPRKPRLRAIDRAQHPVGRVGRPEDIAALCAFLLSDDAGFITGADYLADGGMTRAMIYAE